MMVLQMLEVVKYKSRLLSLFASAYFTKLISIRAKRSFFIDHLKTYNGTSKQIKGVSFGYTHIVR